MGAKLLGALVVLVFAAGAATPPGDRKPEVPPVPAVVVEDVKIVAGALEPAAVKQSLEAAADTFRGCHRESATVDESLQLELSARRAGDARVRVRGTELRKLARCLETRLRVPLSSAGTAMATVTVRATLPAPR